MAFKFGDVRRNLKKKGFVEDVTKDHVYLRFHHKGKRTHLYTMCSHGADKDDVGHGLCAAMKAQLALESKRQLEDLVTCPMSGEAYLKKLQDRGVIPPDEPEEKAKP